MFSCCYDQTQQLEDALSSMYIIENDTLASIIKEYDSTYSKMVSASGKPYIMVECSKSGNISNIKISYKQDCFRDENHSPMMMADLDGIKVLYQETNGLSKYVRLTDKYEKVFDQATDNDELCIGVFPIWEARFIEERLYTIIKE